MTDWITHNSTEPPELAPAALVEIIAHSDVLGESGIYKLRSDEVWWHPSLEYRPLTDDEGRKIISAEGLNKAARFVTTDDDGDVIQWYTEEPSPQFSLQWDYEGDQRGNYSEAPATHRHPGDWRDSLYRAEGK